MDLQAKPNQPDSSNQVSGVVQESCNHTNDVEDTDHPGSLDGSQIHVAPSNNSSITTISIEERLRRVRAADELKKQQRLVAYLEAQRQAELNRIKQQEERKRKIEEMRQREQQRRLNAYEKRAALDQTNQARMEKIRERSLTRPVPGSTVSRRPVRSVDMSSRTGSASPSLGSCRNPNSLMTSSCVVAFGSSAPRSLCTPPSQAALRLKQSFEARLATYLTGRHSGCFFTSAASPYYACFLNPSQAKHLPAPVSNSGKHRRAVSAHGFLRLKPTITSFRVRCTPGSSDSTSHRSSNAIFEERQHLVAKGLKHIPLVGRDGILRNTEVLATRSSSSQNCDKIKQTISSSTRSVRTDLAIPSGSKKISDIKSTASSVATEPRPSSVRSSSVDRTAIVPSVFDRLTASVINRTLRKDLSSTLNAKPLKSTKPVSQAAKKIANVVIDSSDEKLLSLMSKSVCGNGTYPSLVKQIPNSSDSHSSPHSPRKSEPNSLKPTTILSPKETTSSLATIHDLGSTNSIDSNSLSAGEPTSVVHPPHPNGLGDSTFVKATRTLGPIQAETRGSGEGAVLPESEAAIYKAKLIEQRRLAKERKEEEQRRLEEENRKRRIQQEQVRLAAEKAAQEQAEQAAREAEEAQKRREAEKLARLQALEAESLAKLQREEEERVMRKKKLDSIMSRVKQPNKTVNNSSPMVDLTSPAFTVCDDNDNNLNRLHNVDPNDDVQLFNNRLDVPEPNFDQTDQNKFCQQDNTEPNLCSDTFLGQPLSPTSSSIHDSFDATRTETVPSFIATNSTSGDNKATKMFFLEGNQEDKSTSNGSFNDSIPLIRTNGIHSSSPPMSFGIEDDNLAEKALTSHVNGAVTDFSTLMSITDSNNSRPFIPDSESKAMEQSDTCSDIVAGTLPPSNSMISSSSAPRFKSALLQSMLGGGRLATHAKEAVAGLKRHSASHLSDMQSVNNEDNAQLTATEEYYPANGIVSTPETISLSNEASTYQDVAPCVNGSSELLTSSDQPMNSLRLQTSAH